MKIQVFGKVLRQEKVGDNVYCLTLKAPEIARAAGPGQFIQVRCSNSLQPLLRKPFSLHEIDEEAGTISLLYEVKGEGSKLLAKLRKQDKVDLVGPLGNGFNLLKQGKAILVGGGMGIAPLLPLAARFKQLGLEFITILGFNDGKRVCRIEAFQKFSPVILTTLDGSQGEKGLVTEPLKRELETGSYSMIYACGPEGMLKAVAELAEAKEVECQVSLEAYMACGFGACLGCACQLKNPIETTYARVCTEGPVFKSREVIWHEG